MNRVTQNALYYLLQNGYKNVNKQARNVILSTILVLAKNKQFNQFFEQSQIFSYLIKQTTNNEHFNIQAFTQTNSNEDFEMMCLMFNVIFELCNCYRLLSQMIEYNWFECSINYYFQKNNGNDNNNLGSLGSISPKMIKSLGFSKEYDSSMTYVTNSKPYKWTVSQLKTLRVIILQILSKTIDKIPKHLYSCSIHNILFDFIQSNQATLDTFNSNPPEIMYECISILAIFFNKINRCKNCDDLQKQNATAVIACENGYSFLKGILCDFLLGCVCMSFAHTLHFAQTQTKHKNIDIFSNFTVPIKIKNDGTIICIAVIQNHKTFKQQYGANIMKMLLNLLQSLPFSSVYKNLQISIMRCIMELTIDDQNSQTTFLMEKGNQ